MLKVLLKQKETTARGNEGTKSSRSKVLGNLKKKAVKARLR